MWMSVDSAGHQFVIDFKAYKERLLEEIFDVYSARDKRKTISFVFHARVLGQYSVFTTCQLMRDSYHIFARYRQKMIHSINVMIF